MDGYQGDEELLSAALGLVTLAESKAHSELSSVLDELLTDSKETMQPLESVLPKELAALANSYVNDTQEFVSFVKGEPECFVRLRIQSSGSQICGRVEQWCEPKAEPRLPQQQLSCLCGPQPATEFCASHAWTPAIRDKMKAAAWTPVPDTDFCSEGAVVEVPGKPDTLRLEKESGSRFFCDFKVSHARSMVIEAADAFHFPRSHATRLYALLESRRLC